MIEIDASFGEGGGQILYSALALSAITVLPTAPVLEGAAGEPGAVRIAEAGAPRNSTALLAAQTWGWAQESSS